MENSTSVQQLFFQHVKGNLPGHLSLVDEVADLLNISVDSAYRRIRGEKEISFQEIKILCSHFHVSLDQLLHLDTDSIIFSGRFANNTDFDFHAYLLDILRLLKYINSFERKEILFMSKDIPLFHNFHYPQLTAFKSFFFMKTILQYPGYSKKRFLSDEFTPAIGETCAKIIDAYNNVPSQEIWNFESIHASIRQIEYYKDTKTFASDEDLEKVYECLHKSIDHIEAQVELGCKFAVHEQHAVKRASLRFYINEIVLGDNTYLANLNDSRMVLINHSVLNTIRTRDRYFTESTNEHFQNIIRKSTQISGVGEKERRKFFNVLHEKIEDSRTS